jgi:hypothetical protein
MSKISELSDGGSLTSTDYLIAVRSGGNVKVRMDQINVDQVDLGDNEFIRLGNSQDLTMVHTSTQSIINQAGIGDLLIQKAGATKLTINASGIDVTGTVTADGGLIEGSTGLTIRNDAVGANEPKLVFDNDTFAGATYGQIQTGNGGLQLLIESPSTSTFQNRHQLVLNGGGSTDVTFKLSTDNGTSYKNQLQINNNDISFYEDTGTTPKFFWDASAEALGIGTSSPVSKLNTVLVQADNGSASDTTLANSFHHLGGGEYGIGRYYLTTYGYSTSQTNSGAYIGALSMSSTGSAKYDLVFGTRNVTTDTAPTERMRIDASGLVTVGSAVASTNVEFRLNGVASKAQRIRFAESGVDKWLIGQGASSETEPPLVESSRRMGFLLVTQVEVM